MDVPRGKINSDINKTEKRRHQSEGVKKQSQVANSRSVLAATYNQF